MSKGRRSLNLRSLQAFEAVARHRSMTRAAEELGVTQSAVSHQLRNLTARMGEALTERHGQVVQLTDAGRRLALTLGSAFDIIEQQVAIAEGRRSVVRLGVYSSFGTAWLVPRLGAFLAANPQIDLRLIMLYDPHEVSSRVADLFVTSEPLEIGYLSKRLWAERLVPVAAAGGPRDFASPIRLISAEIEPGVAGRAWEAFAILNQLDVAAIRADDWLCCSHYLFALEMALAGLGAALLPDFVAERPLADGRLHRLPGVALPTGQAYEVHYPAGRRHEAAIGAVLAWLDSARGDVRAA